MGLEYLWGNTHYYYQHIGIFSGCLTSILQRPLSNVAGVERDEIEDNIRDSGGMG